MRVATFDVWGTLLPMGKHIREALAEGIREALGKAAQRVGTPIIMEILDEVERIERIARADSFAFSTPMVLLVEVVKRMRNRGIGVDQANPYALMDSVAQHVAETDVEPDPDAVNVLETLKADGFRLGIVSNVFFWPSHATRAILKRAGLLNYFDAEVYADVMGYAKPNPRIFHFALDLLTNGMAPDLAIHVGDRFSEDLIGAMLSRMVGVLVDREGAEGIREQIRCRAYTASRLKYVVGIVDLVSGCLE